MSAIALLERLHGLSKAERIAELHNALLQPWDAEGRGQLVLYLAVTLFRSGKAAEATALLQHEAADAGQDLRFAYLENKAMIEVDTADSLAASATIAELELLTTKAECITGVAYLRAQQLSLCKDKSALDWYRKAITAWAASEDSRAESAAIWAALTALDHDLPVDEWLRYISAGGPYCLAIDAECAYRAHDLAASDQLATLATEHPDADAMSAARAWLIRSRIAHERGLIAQAQFFVEQAVSLAGVRRAGVEPTLLDRINQWRLQIKGEVESL